MQSVLFYFYYTEFHREVTEVRREQGNVGILGCVTQRFNNFQKNQYVMTLYKILNDNIN